MNELLKLPLKPQETGLLLEQLLSAKHIVITSHQNPDGDAVGSALGLYHILTAMGKTCTPLLPDKNPPFLNWMPGLEHLVFFDTQKPEAENILQQADLIFCLDYNAPERTGKEMGEALKKAKGFKVMIDHHPEPHAFCQVTINYPQDCSTCQLVYRTILTLDLQQHVNAAAATALYTGIMTDTGSFRYPSTTAATHHIVARLIDAGANNGQIHINTFDTNTESRLRLMGYVLSQKLVILPEYGTAYMSLTEQELTQFNYQKGDTEGFVNYGLSLEGIKLAAIFMEKDGLVKISFRSKGNVPVNEFMASNFSGGGHKNAAGGRSIDSLDVTIKRFLSLIPGFMQQYQHD